MAFDDWNTCPQNVFRHYKGGRYVLLFAAETHQHNGDQDAVYLSLTTGKIVTRPLTRDSREDDAWCDIVEWPDGIKRARFSVFESAYDPYTLNPELVELLRLNAIREGLESPSATATIDARIAETKAKARAWAVAHAAP